MAIMIMVLKVMMTAEDGGEVTGVKARVLTSRWLRNIASIHM